MLDLAIDADLDHDKVGDWFVSELHCGDGKPRTALQHIRDGVWMADHRAEVETQREGVEQAHHRGGIILVTGLGLCLFPRLCLRSPNVVKVTVVEKNREVIAMVGGKWSAYFGGRLEIVCADAYEWLPDDGATFTVGWHDPFLFPAHVRPENAADAAKLIERFAPFCDWQGWWKGDPTLKFYGAN